RLDPHADAKIRGTSSSDLGRPPPGGLLRFRSVEPERRPAPPAAGFFVGGTRDQPAVVDELGLEKIAAAHAGSGDGDVSGKRQLGTRGWTGHGRRPLRRQRATTLLCRRRPDGSRLRPLVEPLIPSSFKSARPGRALPEEPEGR